MTNQLITNRLPIDYSLISLMSLMSSISYAWSEQYYLLATGKASDRSTSANSVSATFLPNPSFPSNTQSYFLQQKNRTFTKNKRMN